MILFLVFFFKMSNVFFMSSLISGVVFAVSSDSWFGAWCGLELNLMSFLPLICSSVNQYSSEGALKYFLVQAFSSTLLIFGSFIMLMSSGFTIVVMLALLMKLGAAPTHFWFPQVMESLNWGHCFVLMSVQKVAPMILISYLLSGLGKYLVYLSCIFSAMVGAWAGYNQVLLRSLLAFSSINHIAWLLISLLISLKLWLTYFFFYMIISFSIICFFYYYQAFHVSQLFCLSSYMLKILAFSSLMSLGGLPPFTGFLPKWFVIENSVGSMVFFPLMILIISTLFTLYYYMRVAFFGLLLVNVRVKWLGYEMGNFMILSIVLSLNLFGLFFPSLMMI